MACTAVLTDIVMEMYVDNGTDCSKETDYFFDEDKEVGGADLVEQLGETLLNGAVGSSLQELLDTYREGSDDKV
jgi:hypothetical protein